MTRQEYNNIHSARFFKTKIGLATKIINSQIQSSKRRKHILPNYNRDELYEWLKLQNNFNKLFENYVKSGYKKMLVPSCDRLDDYKPYTLDNLRLVTWNINKNKSFIDKKQGINNKQSKAILQYTKNNIFIKEWYSISEAARNINGSKGNIQEVCSGKRKTAYKFKWRYKDVTNQRL